MDKSPEAFRTISEVAAGMDLPQHVLRFWETRFPQIKPLKRGGGRRYYRPDDIELAARDQAPALRSRLHDQGRAEDAARAGRTGCHSRRRSAAGRLFRTCAHACRSSSPASGHRAGHIEPGMQFPNDPAQAA